MPTFEEWMLKVDRLLIDHIGLDHDDLPDQGYWDAWDSEYTPEEMIAEMIADGELPE